ncbi:MAG: lipopolysaccharide kinase InaA family protein [Pseudomonadota bacterium]|nr:lipopolysaccharide kinase InaA family protein [Pseudomonadota bacterium]
MSRQIITTATPLPPPWHELDYKEIMTRSGGRLINDGRSSRVYRFVDGESACFLKRYTYRKIHWQHCWQKSQVRREYENLKKIEQSDLGCGTIEILAYGEQRRGRVLIDAFLLSRAVEGGESLAHFLSLNGDHPQRKIVLEKLFRLGQEIIKSGLAITDLFFRNIVVVPEDAELYLLDVQRCDHNQRRARMKSYPQYWSNILLFCTPAEQKLAAETLLPHLPYDLNELSKRAQQFIHKEKKRKAAELAFSKLI